jgi:hypothetical protein
MHGCAYVQAMIGLMVVTVAGIEAGAWITRILPESLRRFERATFVVLGGFGELSTVLFLAGVYRRDCLVRAWRNWRDRAGASAPIMARASFRVSFGSVTTRSAAIPAVLCILLLMIHRDMLVSRDFGTPGERRSRLPLAGTKGMVKEWSHSTCTGDGCGFVATI